MTIREKKWNLILADTCHIIRETFGFMRETTIVII